MAAAIIRFSHFRICRYLSPQKYEKCQNIRLSSHDSKDNTFATRSSWVVLTDDGETIVCWHPEQQFPYECSKPLPILDPKLKEGDSPLKLQYRMEDMHRNKPDGPNRLELQAITFTNKHIWFPHKGKRYRKPNPPKDRDGL